MSDKNKKAANAEQQDDLLVSDKEQAEETETETETETAEAENSNQDDELSQAQAEIAELKDAYLRVKAEQENIRRRSEKEIANGRKFAVESFAKEMLNVRDSLKLARDVEVPEDAQEAVKGIHEGVEITLKQLDSVFERFSLTEIAPEQGDKLDPNLHQAMSMVESDDVESGCIINVVQLGFQLHDRLLRPAMVVVAK